MRPLEATPFQAVDRALLSGSEPLRTRLRIAMDNTRLPDDIRALNAKLKANPVLTENMGPVHVLTVQGRSSGRPQATPVSPVTCGGHRLAATLTVAWRSFRSAAIVRSGKSGRQRQTRAGARENPEYAG